MAMNCKRCEDRLSAYADGALSSKAAAAVYRHLTSCDQCRRELDEIVALKQLLGGSATPTTRPGFWAETLGRVAPAVDRRRRAARAVRKLRLAGVAITASALGVARLELAREPVAAPGPPQVEAATFDPAALVSMHAFVRATRPLADTGKVRFAISEGNARDYANDARLDGQ